MIKLHVVRPPVSTFKVGKILYRTYVVQLNLDLHGKSVWLPPCKWLKVYAVLEFNVALRLHSH